MVSLSSIDFAVVGFVLLLFFSLGFSAKLKENSSLQLIAAGRNLTLPLFVATLVTTWYGGILGVGEMVGTSGVSAWLLIGVPYYLFGLLFAVFMARRVRQEKPISLPERLHQCYGKPAGVIGALLVLVFAAPATHILMLATLLQLSTSLSFEWCLLLGAGVGTLFLYKGGLLADARSNLVSFAMMYLSFAVIVIYCWSKFGSPLSVISSLPVEKQTLSGGNGIGAILAWMLLGAWTFVDPGFHQRVAAASSPDTSRRGVLISVGFWVIFDLLSISAALYGIQALGTDKGASLFPIFGSQVLPDGLRGIFFAGMFGVVLSAMVGYTLVSGATIGRDLVARIHGSLPENRITLWTRIGILVATCLGIGLAYSIPSVVYLWYDIGGILVPGLIYPTLFAYAFKRPLPNWSAISCLLGGSVSAFLWYRFGNRADYPALYIGLAVSTMLAIAGLIQGAINVRRTAN